jgi:hypothetical protein
VDLRIRFSDLIAPPTANVVTGFTDGNLTFQCCLALTTARQFAIYRGAVVGGTLLGTLSSYTLPTNTFVHVSWKAVIDNSVGSSVLKIYEFSDLTTPVATLTTTGVDTQATANARWDGYPVVRTRFGHRVDDNAHQPA